jgi:predicted RND superfamily exporter protein
MAFQWKNMRFTYTEANLLPDDHIINQEYNSFLEKFGEEGNLVVIGFKDSTFFTQKNILLWENFISEIKTVNRRFKSTKKRYYKSKIEISSFYQQSRI